MAVLKQLSMNLQQPDMQKNISNLEQQGEDVAKLFSALGDAYVKGYDDKQESVRKMQNDVYNNVYEIAKKTPEGLKYFMDKFGDKTKFFENYRNQALELGKATDELLLIEQTKSMQDNLRKQGFDVDNVPPNKIKEIVQGLNSPDEKKILAAQQKLKELPKTEEAITKKNITDLELNRAQLNLDEEQYKQNKRVIDEEAKDLEELTFEEDMPNMNIEPSSNFLKTNFLKMNADTQKPVILNNNTANIMPAIESQAKVKTVELPVKEVVGKSKKLSELLKNNPKDLNGVKLADVVSIKITDPKTKKEEIIEVNGKDIDFVKSKYKGKLISVIRK